MATVTPIGEVLNRDGPSSYYTQSVRKMLEYHIPYLRRNNRSTVINIDPHVAWEFEYDLNGLLLHFRIPWNLHWITMRLNDMHAPDEYRHTMLALYIPDVSVVDKLVTRETTIQRNL